MTRQHRVYQPIAVVFAVGARVLLTDQYGLHRVQVHQLNPMRYGKRLMHWQYYLMSGGFLAVVIKTPFLAKCASFH